ncbi:MAG: ATP-binding protein [Lactobacillales bacterium]|jgi:AAA+ ATPase superfamily predicted ATPase|nr:ATP-binding protein [Lactobacillales bacterium]
MNLFIGRKEELDVLQEQYVRNQFEFTVIYGRRRVGKTTLIQEFIENKKVIYFQAVEANAKTNLELFSAAITQSISSPVYESFTKAFEAITECATREKIVLIIDEFPYLASAEKSTSSLLQRFIDQKWKNMDFQLILCGSSMSFMEKQVLGAKSPLYGRRTAQLKIEPFTFEETREFFPTIDSEKAFDFFAITGGIPQYLKFVNPQCSVFETIEALFFKRGGALVEEPSNLLKQELKDSATYMSILEAIATGSSKMNEISTKTGIETSNLSTRLVSLIELGLVEKVYPVGNEKSKNTMYKIKDNMFRFWYRFVFPNQTLLFVGRRKELLDFVEQNFNDFCAPVFENFSRRWVVQHSSYMLRSIGSWWGTKTKERGQEEIDILGIDISGNQAVFGECKWRNEKTDTKVVRTLLERANLFSYTNKELYVFSRNTFTEGAAEFANENHVVLVTFAEMTTY